MRFHHVNLAVHPDLVDAEIDFLLAGLGMERLEPPAEFANVARWFQFSDGAQIHLTVTTDSVQTPPGHIAIEVGSDLDGLNERLATRGWGGKRREGPSGGLSFVTDPGGHLWELRQTV
jgi:catechol 2,3-dioxygenase-like lactoylglutathione lyase family enzyme